MQAGSELSAGLGGGLGTTEEINDVPLCLEGMNMGLKCLLDLPES